GRAASDGLVVGDRRGLARVRVRVGVAAARGAVEARRAGPVGRLQGEVTGLGAVALRVVHDRLGVVRGQDAPVIVLEARARLGTGVLVAEAQRVAELV